MPTYNAPKPFDIPELASRLPEPARQAGGFIGQLLQELTGSDPMTGAYPTPLAAPMVSIYKDASGVPSKALREEGLQRFRDSAQTLYDRLYNSSTDITHRAMNNFAEAADWLAMRYPRVAAHMRIAPELVEQPSGVAGSNFLAHIRTPVGKVRDPMVVEYSTNGFKANDGRLADNGAYNTMAHEATHAAQALGNKDFSQLYDQANNAVGYHQNPFEQMARNAGENAELPRRADKFPQQTLHPDVKAFVRKVAADRHLTDPGDKLAHPDMLDAGFKNSSALKDTLLNIFHNLNTTSEDRSLLKSVVERMRKGGPGYETGRDGHPVYKEFLPAQAPDGHRNATATRLLEDIVRAGPPATAYGPAPDPWPYQAIEDILKRRSGK
jgi:hypothetical protein